MEKVAKLSKLKEKMCISVKGKELALFKIEDKIYCIDNICPHAGGPLCGGELEGKIVVCPWHSSKFDVTNGKVKSPPAKQNVRSYKVTVKEEDIFVEI